jgi:hypothetical protein
VTFVPHCHSGKKINKETSEVMNILQQIDMTGMYKIFCPTATECKFFSAVHGTFSKIDHILGNKASLDNYKK